MRIRVLQIGMLVGLLAIGIVLWQIKSRWWLAIILVPVFWLLLIIPQNFHLFFENILHNFSFCYCCCGLALIYSIQYAINVENPPEWDYTSFWLNGRLAVQRLIFMIRRIIAKKQMHQNYRSMMISNRRLST